MGADPLSDAEIADRIAKDDGDLDEDVLLKRSTGGARRVYHDADEPCYRADQKGYRAGPELITRREARERGLAPCKRCLIGFGQDEHDSSLYEAAKAFDPDRHDSLADVSSGGDA